MMFDMLLVLIPITVILFILICYYLFVDWTPTIVPEKLKPGQHIGNWRISVVLITVNIIFIVLISMGFFQIEWFYTSAYYIENGTYIPSIFSTQDTSYQVYTYVFFVFGLIHVVLFFYAGYHAWQDALNTKGDMEGLDYGKNI